MPANDLLVAAAGRRRRWCGLAKLYCVNIWGRESAALSGVFAGYDISCSPGTPYIYYGMILQKLEQFRYSGMAFMGQCMALYGTVSASYPTLPYSDGRKISPANWY